MTRRLPSDEWWNAAIGRSVRTVWHWVGFYAVAAAISTPLTDALVVGAVPTVLSVPAPRAILLPGTLGLAVALSLGRPAVSSARTLVFGFVGGLLFTLLMVLFGDTNTALSGKPLVGLDIALAGIAAVTLAAGVALEFDFDDLRREPGHDRDDDTGGDAK